MVITIIGILIALLLPAVQAAREAARRVQCCNNLKQLALGCLGHEQAQGWFPTGGWTGWVGDPDRGFSVQQVGGWFYNTLPYLEQSVLHNLGSDGSSTDSGSSATKMNTFMLREATPLAMLACPTRRRCGLDPNYYQTAYYNMNKPPALTRNDYAVNGGDVDFNGSGLCELGGGQYVSSLSTGDNPSYQWPSTATVSGISFLRSRIKMADITDGTTNTYLLGEKYLDSDYYETGVDPGDNDPIYEGFANDNTRYAGEIPAQDTPGSSNWCMFGSAHGGLFHMAFCDGSVTGINYSIALTVHQALANRHDGQTIDGKSW